MATPGSSLGPAVHPDMRAGFQSHPAGVYTHAFGAMVTLRIYIPASVIAGLAFDVAYPVIAWLCWVPNAMVAEVVVRQTEGVSRRGIVAAGQ